jgi:O-antigen biosynthesis protein
MVIPFYYQQPTHYRRRRLHPTKSSRSDDKDRTNADVNHTIVNTSDSMGQMEIKVLFFSQVSIEPTYSAAGVRSMHLLRKLRYEIPNVTSVHIITPPNKMNSTTTEQNTKQPTPEPSSAVHTDLDSLNTNDFQYHTLLPNRSEDADRFLDQLYRYNNVDHLDATTLFVIIFDRYYSEEMYSFHVYNYFRTKNQLHNATFILDMQDMHSLRLCRQSWVQERHKQVTKQRNRIRDSTATNCIDDADDVLQHTIPSNDIIPTMHDDKLLRELASIYRCDLTFVCSSYEYTLLINKYQIPETKLCIAPLFGTNQDNLQNTLEHKNVCYHERNDYIFVGGMKHEPNVDAIRQLKRLWPFIRQKFIKNQSSYNAFIAQKEQKQLPNLYIYGAFCSTQFRHEIHQPSIGLFMEGYYSSSIFDVLRTKRVLLSPLRFGAGIKGKHIDAWRCYLPIVTTSIGSEGMFDNPTSSSTSTVDSKFGGLTANTDSNFVDGAYTLYQTENIWNAAVSNISKRQMQELCNDWDRIHSRVMGVVLSKSGMKQHSTRQQKDTILQHILWHQTNRSTEYFSKYIEWKERSTRNTPHE